MSESEQVCQPRFNKRDRARAAMDERQTSNAAERADERVGSRKSGCFGRLEPYREWTTGRAAAEKEAAEGRQRRANGEPTPFAR